MASIIAGATGIPSSMHRIQQKTLRSAVQKEFFKTETIMPKNIVSESDLPTHKLNVRLIADPKKYDNTRDLAQIRTTGYSNFLYSFKTENDSCQIASIDVPEGIYTILSEFELKDSTWMYGKKGVATVILEGIEIKADKTIDIKASDAKNKVTFNCVNPDGQTPTLKCWDYSSGTLDLKEGNISETEIENIFMSKKLGRLYSRGTTGNYTRIQKRRQWDLFRFTDVYINDVSDDIGIIQTRGMSAKDGFYYTVSKPIFGIKKSMDAVFETKYDCLYTEEYKGSKLHDSIDIKDYAPVYYYSNTKIGPEDQVDSRGLMANSGKLQCAGLKNSSDFFKTRFNFSAEDYAKYEIDPEKGDTLGIRGYASTSQPIYFNENNQPVRAFTQVLSDYTKKIEFIDKIGFAGHEAFSADLSDCDNKLGDSQPAIVLQSMKDTDSDDWESKEFYWYVTPFPIGRLGELRTSDMLTSVDSEKVLENGLFEYSGKIANNIIDGIDGETSYLFRIDHNKEICAPVVQMLQFRNKSGRVTDRFPKPSDGIIRIAAGDFNQNFGNDSTKWWYTTDPVNIKVEYAPLKSQDWKEIKVFERSEWFSKEIGQVFEGNLDGIGTDYSGWYKLRISLTDKTGSFHEQTIKPAFKIGDDSGIDNIKYEDEAFYIKDNVVISGSDAKSIQVMTASGICVLQTKSRADLAPLPAGIYIIRSESKAIKYLKK